MVEEIRDERIALSGGVEIVEKESDGEARRPRESLKTNVMGD